MLRKPNYGTDCGARLACASKQRSVSLVELIITAALAVSTAIAVTAVSIGIARADVIGVVASGDSTPFAVVMFIALLLGTMGALTAMVAASPCAIEQHAF
jgi:hypothetical protein